MLELDRRVLVLLGLLHEAPGNAAAWGRFLDAFRAAISPDAVTIFASQPHEGRPGVLAGSGLGVRLVDLNDFLRPSVRHPNATVLPVGGMHELPADSSIFRETSLFRDVLGPAGVLAGPGLFVVTERSERHVKSAVLVLPRKPTWKPTPADRALFQRLAPHMVIARRLHLRLVERGRDTAALSAAFDHLVLGVIFLDDRLRVSYANLSAAEILGVRPGFADRAALAAELPDERTRALQRLLQSELGGERTTLVCAHPEDGRPLQVLSTPFGWRDAQVIGGVRYSRALFIGDPKRRAGDPIDVLHALYGMTRGEARLTMLLLGGCSVEEAAHLSKISIGTARGVLKKVFDKTGTNRQASLVRLLLTGFGQVRHEPDAQRPAAAPQPPRRERG
jgi:PAS domain-containing protein